MKYLTTFTSLLAVASAGIPRKRANGPSAGSSSQHPRIITPNLARDAATLIAFAKTVTYDPLGYTKTWVQVGRTPPNPCNFKGVFCEKRPDTGVISVAAIDINGCRLKGSPLKLTNFLEKFPDLTFLHANQNGFSGAIPDFSAIKYLNEIDLGSNNLAGPFPTNILRATKLDFIDMSDNQLSGPIPPAVFNMKLDALGLGFNKFTGVIPPNIGNLPVSLIYLNDNGLTGRIPDSIADMPYLYIGYFQNNALTGGIPERLCAKMKRFKVLDFSGNKFTVPLGPNCQAMKRAGKLKV